MDQQQIDDLKQIIDEGWQRFEWASHVGYCLLGAAGKAWHGNPKWFKEEENNWTEDEQLWLKKFSYFIDENYGAKMIHPRSAPMSDVSMIIEWNDRVVKNREEIIAVLDEID